MLSSKPLRWICTYFLVHLTLFIFITIVLYLSSLFFGHNCGIYHLCSLFWIVMFLTVNYILNPYNFTEEGEVEPHVAFRKIFKKGVKSWYLEYLSQFLVLMSYNIYRTSVL